MRITVKTEQLLYKMASPLNTCIAIQQRGIVRLLWAKNMAAQDIPKEMLSMYGESSLSREAVHNCVHKFSAGRTCIKDEHRLGRSVEIATPVTLPCIEGIIRADRRVTTDAVATAIRCLHCQAYSMMHERLGFHRVLSIGATPADNSTHRRRFTPLPAAYKLE
jgi:hypothetical protein